MEEGAADTLDKKGDDDGIPEGDYVEKRKFCYCLSYKVGIFIFGIFLIIDFIIQILEVIFILTNEYFDNVFGMVYLLILIPLFVAVLMYMFFYCTKDSKSSRSIVPWTFLLAAFTSFFLVIWITVYICVIYNREKVYVNKWDNETTPSFDENETKSGKYTKINKANYIVWHLVGPIIYFIAYSTFWFASKDWVDRHKNQDKAHG